jgi:hypothetical protein
VPVPANLILLRGLIPELPMRPGDLLPARVYSRDTIVLAGVRIAAQLPENLEAGQRLRLRVEEASRSRLLLRVVETSAAGEADVLPQSVTADPLADALRAGLALPLPGGQVARLFVQPDGGSDADAGRPGALQRVTLRFEAAALGRVDLALEVRGGRDGIVTGTVHAPAGAAAHRLAEHAGELRAALAQATGRPATVSVRQRGETVDLRA